ncbi:hypothetical protein N9A58_04725 [Opitutales bacterium]|nr:hypothetical protein [Opitutales bacterium]MDG1173631.1 hypothetical protein [Opitutales bacterium]
MKHIFLRSLKLFFPLILIHFGACTLESDGEELEWTGNKESFDEEFTLMQTLDSEAVLIKRVNKELVSGVIEFESDNITTRQNFASGQLNGKSTKRNKDGSWVEAHYLNGSLHGDMKFYDSKDNVRSSISYRNGKLCSVSE